MSTMLRMKGIEFRTIDGIQTSENYPAFKTSGRLWPTSVEDRSELLKIKLADLKYYALTVSVAIGEIPS